MTGEPPIGTEDAFPKDDPAETAEERRARLAGRPAAAPIAPMTAGTTAGTTMDAQARADAIVRRESGVADFSEAVEEDRAGTYQVEDYPSQDDPTSTAGMSRDDDPMDDTPGDVAARGINDSVQAAESLVDGDPGRDLRSRP